MEAFKQQLKQSSSPFACCSSLFSRMSRVKTVGSDFFDTNLKRCLKLLDIVFLGTGHMIGAGVYILTGSATKNKAGPALIISYMMSGVAAFLASLCYAEFGGRVPKAGSAYSYGYVTIGEFWAFVIGWDMLLENLMGASALGVAWAGYLDGMTNQAISNATREVFGSMSETALLSSQVNLIAPLLIIAVSLFMAAGARTSTNFNSIFAVVNLLVIGFTVIFGLTKANTAYLTDPSYCYSSMNCYKNGTGNCTSTDAFMPFGFTGVVSGAAEVFFSYVGFESIASAGEETINPQKVIPLGTLIAMVIVTVSYILMSTTLTLMVPFCKIRPESAFAAVFQEHGSIWAKYVVSVGALSGMTTVLYGSLFATPRGVYAMALDGLLCKCFAYIHPRLQTPLVGVVVFGLAAAFVSTIFSLEVLAEFVSIGTLMAYSIVACSVIILRYKPQAFKLSKITSAAMLTSRSDNLEQSLEKPGELKSNFGFLAPLVGHLPPAAAVTYFTFLMTVAMFALAAVIHFSDWTCWWTWIIFAVILFIVLASLFVIFAHEQNMAEMSFKVPWVPVLPAVSLQINIIFLMHLSGMTWMRFAVWMVVGVIIYFSYGIWNSTEGKLMSLQNGPAPPNNNYLTDLNQGQPKLQVPLKNYNIDNSGLQKSAENIIEMPSYKSILYEKEPGRLPDNKQANSGNDFVTNLHLDHNEPESRIRHLRNK